FIDSTFIFFFLLMNSRPPCSTLFPYTTLFRSCLVRGDGSWVWDAEGNRYLDFFPGWGCGILGHCPPRVVEAVREQVATLIHVPKDRKSTRLNSSHVAISYAVFCLKKKKN